MIQKNKCTIKLDKNQPYINKIQLHAYQFLINKRERVGINRLNDPKDFIECFNDMHKIYKNIDNYNPDKKK